MNCFFIVVIFILVLIVSINGLNDVMYRVLSKVIDAKGESYNVEIIARIPRLGDSSQIRQSYG